VLLNVLRGNESCYAAFSWHRPAPWRSLARPTQPTSLRRPPALPPPVFTWTGFYAGLNAGYTFGGSNSVEVKTASGVGIAGIQPFSDAVAASATDVLSLRNSGFIGGGQVGYNLQFANSWLVGIEADIQGTGARSSDGAIGTVPVAGVPPSILQAQSNISVNTAVDYLGTVRGRLGFLVTPALLIFGDGGFAYGGVHEGVDIVSTFPPTGLGTTPAFGSFTSTRTGWTAGGGLEWMFSPNWSLKAEYLYYDLGRATFDPGLTFFSAGSAIFTDLPVASTRFNGHIVRVA
jgi:outer membrane immunogenic protein